MFLGYYRLFQFVVAWFCKGKILDLPIRMQGCTVCRMARGYGQFCPLSKAAEVFAERWTPLVLRELCAGSRQFNEIHNGVPLMSRSLLAQRLRELAAAGVVEITAKPQGRGSEYRLTGAGFAFCPIVDQLSDWGATWVRESVLLDNCDPSLLMWAIRRNADPRWLPEDRFVVRFELRGMPSGVRFRRLWWLVGDRGEVDVCLHDPGFPVRVVIAAEILAFTRVYMGYEGLLEAQREGKVALDGARHDVTVAKRLLDLRERPCVKPARFTATAQRLAAS